MHRIALVTSVVRVATANAGHVSLAQLKVMSAIESATCSGGPDSRLVGAHGRITAKQLRNPCASHVSEIL
jgi:hypothetical protein